MRVKEWVDGGLVLDGDILEGAEEAFNEARYVEAFALIHALIDWWMTRLYQMREVTIGNKLPDDIHFKQEYRFKSIPKPIVEILGKPNQITFIIKGKKVELRGNHDGSTLK